MVLVDTPWERLPKFILFVFGIPIFLIGVILLVVSEIWAIILIGSIWIIFGIGLKIKSIYNSRKLETLKRKGIYYEGSVVKIIPVPWIRIGSFITARVECLYKTKGGDFIARSGYYLLLPSDRREDLYARIYIDQNNSGTHMVELFRKNYGVSI